MAIITEHIMINNKEFIKTYSDSNRYVVREGISYDEAIDPAGFDRVYTEGELKLDDESESNADEILNIILGGDDV